MKEKKAVIEYFSQLKNRKNKQNHKTRKNRERRDPVRKKLGEVSLNFQRIEERFRENFSKMAGEFLKNSRKFIKHLEYAEFFMNSREVREIGLLRIVLYILRERFEKKNPEN